MHPEAHQKRKNGLTKNPSFGPTFTLLVEERTSRQSILIPDDHFLLVTRIPYISKITTPLTGRGAMMVMPYVSICRLVRMPGSVVDLWKAVTNSCSFIFIGVIKPIKDQSIPLMVKRK